MIPEWVRRARGRRDRLYRSLVLLLAVILGGTVGYHVLGLDWTDSVYQTVISVTTVGYREVGGPEQVDTAYKVFTAGFVLVGVGAALYTLTVAFEGMIEGRLDELFGRRRMERELAALSGHVVICGAGRVGRALAEVVVAAGKHLVAIDSDEERVEALPAPVLHGDAREDEMLRRAGVERASTLVAALASDADNVYVALAARALNPSLFIVSRAHSVEAVEKMQRAGADRIVNPEHIGGQRMAAFALQPNVAEFVDVVMHEGGVEWRMEEMTIRDSSPLSGSQLGDANLSGGTGAMVLALRRPGGPFITNPPGEARLDPGSVLIAMGTEDELQALERRIGN